MNDEETVQGPDLTEAEIESNPVAAIGWVATDVVGFAPYRRILAISGEITQEKVVPIVSQLLALDALEEAEIKLFLYSGGGDAEAGFALHDVIKSLRSKLTIICIGQVMSAALILLQAAETRLATPNCRFMHHTPSSGQVNVMTPQMATQFALSYHWVMETGDKIMRDRSGIPEDVWDAKFKNATAHEFGAEEALEWGLVDAIVTTGLV